MKRIKYLLTFCVLVINLGCSGDEDEAISAVFDPHELERGAFVGELTVTEVEHYDSGAVEWSGIVTFHGDLEISGIYGEHPAFPDMGTVCFFPDEKSVKSLPRYTGDKREGWFSFSNEDDDPLLAPLRNPKTGSARIIISDFFYIYAPSDVENSAKLQEIIDLEAVQ